jgi:hypothetical protein
MRRLFLAVLGLVAQSALASAQSGTSVGSSTAAFGTGVTAARDADAIFWNPALLGVQPFGDVRSAPTDGLRVLSVSVNAAPSRTWLAEAARFGFFDGGSRAAPAWARVAAPSRDGAPGGSADLVWISSATGSLGVSISSHAVGNGEVRSFAAGDSVHRAAYSTAMLALAAPVGRVLGVRARAGVTLKGRVVHVHGAAAWLDSAGTGAVMRETTLRNVPGASADVGVVLQPGPFVVSAVVSDALRMTYRPARGARVRTVVRAPDGELRSEAREIDASDSASVRDGAEALYGATVPPTVARLGASWAGRLGETSVSVERRLRVGGLRQVPQNTWAVAYRFAGLAAPLRVGIGGGGGTSGIQVGWIAPACRFPWALGVGRWRGTRDADASLAVSLSVGSRSRRACGDRS